MCPSAVCLCFHSVRVGPFSSAGEGVCLADGQGHTHTHKYTYAHTADPPWGSYNRSSSCSRSAPQRNPHSDPACLSRTFTVRLSVWVCVYKLYLSCWKVLNWPAVPSPKPVFAFLLTFIITSCCLSDPPLKCSCLLFSIPCSQYSLSSKAYETLDWLICSLCLCADKDSLLEKETPLSTI